MLFKHKTDWNLLAKYMAGETNEKESEKVLLWVESNPRNKALLNEIKTDWEKMDSINERFDVDSAWEKLHDRITGEPVTPLRPQERQVRRMNFSIPVRIAASLLLLAILSVAVITTTGVFVRVNIAAAPAEKGRTIDLPDGSRVFLNAGTEMSYARNFSRSRNVKLSGEAYFEVAPDKSHPFTIYAGNARVEVVGTAFNVNTRKNGDDVEVYVQSGIVQLSENGNSGNSVMLHPGTIGLINHKNLSKFTAENANAIAWKTGALSFSDTPLTEAVSLLSNVYNVNITLSGPGADTIKINGSYENDPLDEILNVISQHNPQLNIAKSEDTIYLSQ